MPIANIRPSTDAWTNQDAPTDNNPRTPRLRVRASTEGHGRYAYIYFAPPFVPGSGRRIVTGRLLLRAAGDWSGVQYLTAKRIIEPWQEGTITWQNAPAVSNDHPAIVMVQDAQDGDLIELDIAQMLGDAAAGGEWYGVRLESSRADAGRRVYSSNASAAAVRPWVVIDHRPPVEAPTLLAPIGGQAVGTSTPTLSWRVDDDEAFEQAASRVQIATDEGFSTIVYDSGKVANVEGQWSLEGHYSLQPDATYYWRAMVWDDADQASQWSDVHELTYATKGKLTIINPPFDVPGYKEMVKAMAPALYWPLDAGDGATDLSGRGHDGTGEGGVTIGGDASDPLERGGTSTAFDGTNDRVVSGYGTRRNYVRNPRAAEGTATVAASNQTTFERVTELPAPLAAIVPDGINTGFLLEGTSNGTSVRMRTETLTPGDHRISAYIYVETLTSGAIQLYLRRSSDFSIVSQLPITIAQGQALRVSNVQPVDSTEEHFLEIRSTSTSPVKVYVTAGLVERGSAAAGPYFDGDGYVDEQGRWRSDNGGRVGWTGTPHASASDKGAFANGTARTFTGWAWRETDDTIDAFMGDTSPNDHVRFLLNAGSGVFSFSPLGVSEGGQWNIWPGIGEWVHWALVFDERTDRAVLFINGEKQPERTITAQWPAPLGTLLVASRRTSFAAWHGKMGHFAVFERALTPEEIAALADPASLSDGPSGHVEDNTPVYVWELQGATQTAYSVEVHRVPREFWGPLSLHFETGWRNGDATQVRQPNYWPLQPGQEYEITVRVRDEVDRATTPGDPGEYVARRRFTFQHAVIEPVASLTATPKGPRVELEWTVNQTPDEFAIKRDGKQVLGPIDPEDVRVSGNTYRMDVWLAEGGRVHTWEVTRIVHNYDEDWIVSQNSANNPTAEAVTNPRGVWLVDPDDGTAVQFVAPDEEGGSFEATLHEAGETYEPVSSPMPVRITDVLGGYRGRYEGGVLGFEAHDAFLRLRSRLKPLRLIHGNLNIPVRLEEPTIQPSAVPGHKFWHASFGFFQVGEFQRLVDR